MAMRNLTQRIGRPHNSADKTIGVKVKRILIVRPNARLGNLLLATPLVQEVIAAFPDCNIDLFVRGNAAPLIFRNYPQIGRIIALPAKPFQNLAAYIWTWITIKKHQYDLVVNVDQHSSSGRLATLLAGARFKIFGTQQLDQVPVDSVHIAKAPVYHFRQFARTTADQPIPSLHLKLNEFEKARGKEILHRLTGNDQKTICIFTYATGDKCYSRQWWFLFYHGLRQNFPDHNIVEILPAHDQSQIDYAAASFYSLDIREIASVVSAARLFIGADSGMMHLASAAQATTIGLFSVTNIPNYEPYGNHSIAIDTRHGNLDTWFETIRSAMRAVDVRREIAG